jgi:hypothetical protein
LLIVMHCLDQGPLPDDDDEIAFITAIAPERIKLLRPYLNRLCQSADGTIIPNVANDTASERKEFSEKKAKAGRKGGEQSQAKPSSAQAVLESAQAKPSSAQADASQTDRQTDRQTDMQETRAGDSPSPVYEALEEIYPGSANNFRTMREMFDLAGRLHATPEQVRNFPAWLAEKHPRKADGPFTFRDLFPQSLKNGNGHHAPPSKAPAHNCPKCKDLGVFTENGQMVRCDCWQKEAA